MNTNPEKTPASDIEKRSVSGPTGLFEAAEKVMVRRRMTNFSEYVRDLIRKDVDGTQPLTNDAQPKREAA